jgi:transcriptional regulator with XRE-family HTH domain
MQAQNGANSPCPNCFGRWQSGKVVKRDLAKSFGIVLRNHRKAVQMTQEKLSEKADVDVKMIGRIENFIRNPSLNLADSLADGLGIPLSQMIKDAEDLRRKQSEQKTPKLRK